MTITDSDIPEEEEIVLSGEYSQSNTTQGPLVVTVTSGLQVNRTYWLGVTVTSSQMTATEKISFSKF